MKKIKPGKPGKAWKKVYGLSLAILDSDFTLLIALVVMNLNEFTHSFIQQIYCFKFKISARPKDKMQSNYTIN